MKRRLKSKMPPINAHLPLIRGLKLESLKDFLRKENGNVLAFEYLKQVSRMKVAE